LTALNCCQQALARFQKQAAWKRDSAIMQHMKRRQSVSQSDSTIRRKESSSENGLKVEAGRLAGMMTPQGLKIASFEDSLA
jgi:hypothetical protein